MKRPTIRQTRAICESLNARAVLVIALSKDNVMGASYGETKLECKQAGFTLDKIIEAIENGWIPVWAERDVAQEERQLKQEGCWCSDCDCPRLHCMCDRERTHLQEPEL